MMVECGTQTSITGVDLKPYENKHLKFVEALHRKCITDYIMKDDSTCMFFTGNIMCSISEYFQLMKYWYSNRELTKNKEEQYVDEAHFFHQA